LTSAGTTGAAQTTAPSRPYPAAAPTVGD
jgi:hypothetical protein